MAIWTCPEISAGFLVICLPVLPRLYQHLKYRAGTSKLSTTFRTLFGLGNAKMRDSKDPVKIYKERVPRQEGPWANVIITDPEFHNLVHGEDLDVSTVTSVQEMVPASSLEERPVTRASVKWV